MILVITSKRDSHIDKVADQIEAADVPWVRMNTEDEAEGGTGVGVGLGVDVGVGVAVGVGVLVGVAVGATANSGTGVEVGVGSESPHAVISRTTVAMMKVRINGDLRMVVIIALSADLILIHFQRRLSVLDRPCTAARMRLKEKHTFR